MSQIAETIKYKCKCRDISRQKLLKILNISQSTLYAKYRTPTEFTLGEILLINKLTGMSMEDWQK